MLLVPAIDLKDGHCVRLVQGDMNQATVFSENPLAMAEHWHRAGASMLHLVDLNGAFAGKPVNLGVIREIVQQWGSDMAIEVGGGIRSLETIEAYVDMGVDTVVIGTQAIKSPGFLHDACDAFPGSVAVSMDARGGKVATDGWSKLTRHAALDLAIKFETYGISRLIYTDIDLDGTLSGFNVESTRAIAQALSIPVFASGGIATMADIEQLLALEEEGVGGAILGRSIYQGTIDYAAALALVNSKR